MDTTDRHGKGGIGTGQDGAGAGAEADGFAAAGAEAAGAGAARQTYIAHYVSPVTENPARGFFEFESACRASTKHNRQDARIRMLELFGKEAVSWTIDGIKPKKKRGAVCSDQLELDFREPKQPRKRRISKKYL